jgi:O-antigen biosynthesis protein
MNRSLLAACSACGLYPRDERPWGSPNGTARATVGRVAERSFSTSCRSLIGRLRAGSKKDFDAGYAPTSCPRTTCAMSTSDELRPPGDRSVSSSGGGSASPPDNRSALPPVPDDLIASLEWMSDRLAELAPPDETDDRHHLPWGLNAALHAPTYWHWLHLRSQMSAERSGGRTLPTEGPLMSIVVPVYRPSHWYFRECIQAVLNQTYQRWELCLCDDGSGDPALSVLMKEFAAEDRRIRIMTLERNGGISRATNAALATATGEFVVLLDHDDVLDREALAELARVVADVEDVDVIYTDEDKLDELDRPFQPQFKPDWDPDLLLSFPYLGHLTAIRHDLMRRIGGFRPEFDGSQDYDVMLRATEQARRVVHIPRILYHWRVVAGSAAGDPGAKPWAYLASRRALDDAVKRQGIDGEITAGPFQGGYHLRRRIDGVPTVSVIMPFRDQAAFTVTCLDSLDVAPGHTIDDTVLIDNGSTEPETRVLRRRLETRPDTRVIEYPGAFNWAAINNAAAATCTSNLLLFLNNDIEAGSEGWLHALVEQAQRPEVGAVGACLRYPDGRLQHAGVVLGLGAIAGHLFAGMPNGDMGYFGWDRVVRQYSAVTAACMMVRRDVFEELGGFDESFAVGFNDVDFCIRARRAGYRILYTPHAELTHHESVSRGLSGYHDDYQRFLARWTELLERGDPFYNPNLGRLDAWCPLRPPEEDDIWLSRLGGLVRTTESDDTR